MESKEWTPEYIRKNAQNWSLEGDSRLLELMKTISDNLVKRANVTVKNVNTMGMDLEKTSLHFENVSNKLSTLSKSQFVENRVCDDDDIKPNQPKKPENKKTYNPDETMKIILANNLKMLENCFEEVSVDLDDSDEDEEGPSTVFYRAKNPYAKRLPALIGSKEWNEKWHVGLIDSDDETPSDKQSAREEFSEDSDENISLPSMGPTISESGSSVWSINRTQVREPRSKLDVDSIQSSDEENKAYVDKTMSTKKPKSKSPIQEKPETEKYYIHKPRDKKVVESSDSDVENRNKLQNNVFPNQQSSIFLRQKEQNVTKISNIFSDEPPAFDSNESPNRFNKNVANDLFASDSDDASTPLKIHTSDRSKITRNNNSKVPEGSRPNLFEGNDFDSLIKELNKNSLHQKSKKLNLFNSDSESESIYTDKVIKKELPYVDERKISSKVRDSVDTLIVNDSRSIQKNTSHKDSKSGHNNVNFLDDYDEEDNLFTSVKTENKSLGFLGSQLISKTKISNLFDDEPPEDDFDNLFKSTKNDMKNKTDDVFTKVSDTVKNENRDIAENLLSTESEADERDNLKIENSFNQSKNTLKTDSITVKRKQLVSNLFSADWSDDDEELFIPNAQITKPKTEFNKNQDDELKTDLKVKTQTIPAAPPIDFDVSVSPKIERKEPNFSSSLFDENLEDDLFKPVPELTENSPSISTKITNNITNNQEVNEIALPKAPSKNDFISSAEINDKEKEIKAKNENVQEVDVSSEERNKLDVSLATATNERDDVTPKIGSIENEKEQVPISKEEHSESPSFVIKDVLSNEDQFDSKNIENQDNDDYIFERSIKPSAVDKKTDLFAHLFLDTPPEDDEFFTKTYKKNNDMSDSTEDIFSKPSEQVYNNNVIGLLNDIPPDDDVNDVEESSNKIFEDASNQIFENEISSTYVIHDEPPPDDYFDQDITIQEASSNSDLLPEALKNVLSENRSAIINTDDMKIDQKSSTILKQAKDTTKKPSNNFVTDMISVHDQFTEKSKESHVSEKSEQKPKKLKTKLEINVKALLPGAKRNNFNKSVDETDSSAKISNIVVKNENESNLNNASTDNEPVAEKRNVVVDENKLIGLNKSRAKILVKRRPSTRRARQENYRKSMLESETISDEENSISSSEARKAIRISSVKKEELINTEAIDQHSTRKNQTQNVSKNIDSYFNQNTEIAEDQNTVINRKHSLFDDIENESLDSNWLSESSKTGKAIRTSSVEKEELINSEAIDQHSIRKNQSRNVPKNIDSYFNQNTEKTEEQRKHSLFDDIENESLDSDWLSESLLPAKTPVIQSLDRGIENIVNDGDNIFENSEKTNNIRKDVKITSEIYTNSDSLPDLDFSDEKSKKTSISHLANNSDLFDDLDNDDDDLFSSPFVKVIAPKAQNKNAKITDDEIFKKVKIKSQDSVTVNTSNKEKQIKKTFVKKAKSLFSSDEEEEDLFGINSSNKKSNLKKTEEKPNKLKVHGTKPKSSLFEDIGDDSDEDLFGTTKVSKGNIATKTTTEAKPSRGAIPKRPVEKKISKIPDNNNPLADLLNQ